VAPSFAALTARRTAERERLAWARAALVIERLGALGIEARVVGSLARGDFRLHSDVDFLILACPPELKYRIEALVEDLMEGLPFDCIYLDEVRPERRARLLEEARVPLSA
jgi:predicted nucleotidyltransferase